MTDRTTLITETVANLVTVHDQWRDDPSQPDVPTERFEGAVNEVAAICEHGDVPEKCRDLVRRVEAFLVEWRRYAGGHQIQGGLPHSSLWTAFKGLVAAFEGTRTPRTNTIEPVSLLLDQAANDPRRHEYVARAYGQRLATGRWIGPFFDDRSAVLSGKVEEQAKWERSEGKNGVRHIPEGWVHPGETARMAEYEAAVQTRLNAIADRERRSELKIDPATIEELLREGQYPDVIAKVKAVSLDEVLAVADELGIEPAERPNLASYKDDAPRDAPAKAPEGGTAEEEAADDTDDETPDDVAIDELIVELGATGELGAAEIRERINADLGTRIQTRRVQRVLAGASETEEVTA